MLNRNELHESRLNFGVGKLSRHQVADFVAITTGAVVEKLLGSETSTSQETSLRLWPASSDGLLLDARVVYGV